MESAPSIFSFRQNDLTQPIVRPYQSDEAFKHFDIVIFVAGQGSTRRRFGNRKNSGFQKAFSFNIFFQYRVLGANGENAIIPREILSNVKDSELEHGHVLKEIAQPNRLPKLKDVPIRIAVRQIIMKAGETQL